MKTRILLTLLCAMNLQTNAFFGSQMLSTAWTATASFCKEHPIAVATVAAACGISYWLYKKYTKTTSAMPSVDQSVTATSTITSVATETPAGGGDASATDQSDASGKKPDDTTPQPSPARVSSQSDETPRPSGAGAASATGEVKEIRFENCDGDAITMQDLQQINNNIYTAVWITSLFEQRKALCGFKIMIGEQFVGMLLYQKGDTRFFPEIKFLVLPAVNSTDINIQEIIKKIKNDNQQDSEITIDLNGVAEDFKVGQSQLYKEKFKFEDDRDDEGGPIFSLSLRSLSAGAGAAGAAKVEDDDTDSLFGSEYTTTDETARLDEVASEEEAASEVEITITFEDIQKESLNFSKELNALNHYYNLDFMIKISAFSLGFTGFRIKLNAEIIGIVFYKINQTDKRNLEIKFLGLHKNYQGKKIIEKIIQKLKEKHSGVTHISATLNDVLDYYKVLQIDLYHTFGLHRKKHASGGDSTRFYRKI